MNITQVMAGKTVESVLKNGSILVIRCTDGTELSIGWRDSDTGDPIKGEPVLLQAGKRIVARMPEREIDLARKVGLR